MMKIKCHYGHFNLSEGFLKSKCLDLKAVSFFNVGSTDRSYQLLAWIQYLTLKMNERSHFYLKHVSDSKTLGILIMHYSWVPVKQDNISSFICSWYYQ